MKIEFNEISKKLEVSHYSKNITDEIELFKIHSNTKDDNKFLIRYTNDNTEKTYIEYDVIQKDFHGNIEIKLRPINNELCNLDIASNHATLDTDERKNYYNNPNLNINIELEKY